MNEGLDAAVESGILDRARSIFVLTVEPLVVAPPTSLEDLLLKLHNEERQKREVKPLVFHPGLVEAARFHSRDMADKGYFSHSSKDGTPASRRIKRFYPWRTFGENIAWNHLSGEAAVRRVMAQWMGSAGHKKNILNPRFKEVGFGIASGGQRTLFTCDLGSR